MSVTLDSGNIIDKIFNELEKFVYYLANGAASANVPLMDVEEIAGELFLELVKGAQYYSDLPYNELLKVIKQMMDNRIGELVYKYCITHRKSAIDAEDINSLDREDEDGGVGRYFIITSDIQVIADLGMQLNPEVLADSHLRVEELCSRLSPNALKVMDAMLNGNELLHTQIALSEIRSKHVNNYESYTPRMMPWQVADSLGMGEDEVRRCIKEIKDTYKQVLENE